MPCKPHAYWFTGHCFFYTIVLSLALIKNTRKVHHANSTRFNQPYRLENKRWNLIKHFDALGLKQPKSCTPNNSRVNVSNKADNTTYWFRFEVMHEACYPPKREGKPAKWATYLKSISLVNESNILKKPVTKPASFWNVSPPPTADLAAVKAFFGEPTATTDGVIYFSKAINDLVEINCQFAVKQQLARAIWVSIIEQRELISYLYFRDLAPGESDDHGSGMAAAWQRHGSAKFYVYVGKMVT